MGETRYIAAGSLIDGSGADVRRNVFLAVREGIITAIGPVADLPGDAGAAVDDLAHCTIVPALVDCCVSLPQSPSLGGGTQLLDDPDPAKKAAMAAQHIYYCHTHGVLGAADCGEATGLENVYAEAVADGSMVDIRCAGSDFLRVSYSANIDDEQAPPLQLGPGILRRILEDRGGRKAVVVANGEEQVAEALEAGCDAIEQGYGMGAANLRKMAEMDVLWIPGILRAKNGLDGAGSGGSVCCRFSTRYVAPGKAVPGAEAFWKKTLADQLAQLKLAREMGVKTAVGTGAGSVGILHGESVVEEMKLFIKAGYTLEGAIRCASENAARFFGMDRLGMLAVGRKATFLISRGSPKQLPRKLSYLEGIYINGAPSGAYRKNPVRSA